MRTVTIHRTRFLESDIHDGDYPRDDTETVVYDDLTAREAADLIRSEGLTFDSTGGGWAADPDGSQIVNYRTGQRVEVSAHMKGWHPRVETAIMAAVDYRPGFCGVCYATTSLSHNAPICPKCEANR